MYVDILYNEQFNEYLNEYLRRRQDLLLDNQKLQHLASRVL